MSTSTDASELRELLAYLTEDELAELDTLLAAEPPTFREFVGVVAPRIHLYRHVETLIDVLQRVADGELDRLMVFMPPRHGKSELVSRLFSAYYLACYPDRWVGLNSYAAALAYTLSRNARENYRRAGGRLNRSSKAVGHWETDSGGGMWAAGVGGPITGKGFHLGVIDDPVKNAQEASSPTVRMAQRDWYDSTFLTRAEPGAAIVIVQTRWHEADLGGWLLDREAEDPERWHIVNMPAIAEEPPEFPATCTLEPDWRQPGEALCPERYPLETLERARSRNHYFFLALYQQRPTARDGDFFRREWFPIVREVPANLRLVRYWDKAATEDGGAFSAGVLVGERDGRYYILDVVRGQWSAGQRELVMRQVAELDRARWGHVTIWTEQEPGSGGKESAQATVRHLAGFDVRVERVTGSKESRAHPLAAQAEFGNVVLKAGAWNGEFLAELMAFPHGAYKDQVDAAAGAFNKLASQAGMDDDELAELLRWQQ